VLHLLSEDDWESPSSKYLDRHDSATAETEKMKKDKLVFQEIKNLARLCSGMIQQQVSVESWCIMVDV